MVDTAALLEILCISSLIEVLLARECYNYKQEPRVRNCDHGCCGDEFEQFCCNITLQIVGSTIGGLIVISVVIGLTYYCCRNKVKQNRRAGLLGRFGLRSNVTHIRQVPQAQNQRVPPPHIAQLQVSHMNPAYIQELPGQPPGVGFYPPTAPGQQPIVPPSPTAPMPPPYTTEPPPPYAPMKGPPPPPPSYNSVVSHMGTGQKYDDYSYPLPPPSS